MINSNAPVLVGIAAGLLGAAVAGAAGLALVFTVDAVYPLEWAAYAAGLAGYPIGVWCGLVVCNKRRQAEGSFWLALLGTLSGVALTLAFWEAVGLSRVTGTEEPFPGPVKIGLLALIIPGALVPCLASLAYNFKPPFGLRESRMPSASRSESVRAARPTQEETQQEAVGTGAVETPEGGANRKVDATAPEFSCPECGLDNPPGSLFCGECGAHWQTAVA